MRRILIALVMSGAVAVMAPAVAMATHHRSHHHHHSRHSRIRHSHFVGKDGTQPGSSGPAGTVTTFTDNGNGTGVLTITLTGGGTVTGNVTADTELLCMSSSATTGDGQGDTGDDQGDNGGSQGTTGDDQGSGDASDWSGPGGDQGSSGGSQGSTGDDQSDGGDQGGDDQGDAQLCTTSALATSTPVSEANLEITSAGAVWDRVVLITP